MATDLETTFANAGLPLPPLPVELAAGCQPWGEWTFGTRQPESRLYEIEAYVAHALRKPEETFLFLGHDGYGTNNWHLHYFVNCEELAVFLQTSWGGAFSSEEESRAVVGHLFQLIQQLLSFRGTLKSRCPDKKLVIIHSEVGSSRWGWFAKTPLEDSDVGVWEFDDAPLTAAIRESHSLA